MSDDLRDALMDIHGIGEAKAGEILDVVDEHGRDGVPEEVREAAEHIEAGMEGTALKFLRRLMDE